METFYALLAICARNSPVPGEFPVQRPVTRSFDVFFDLRPNKQLSKQWWGWWFEKSSCPLWRRRNDISIYRESSTWSVNVYSRHGQCFDLSLLLDKAGGNHADLPVTTAPEIPFGVLQEVISVYIYINIYIDIDIYIDIYRYRYGLITEFSRIIWKV